MFMTSYNYNLHIMTKREVYTKALDELNDIFRDSDSLMQIISNLHKCYNQLQSKEIKDFIYLMSISSKTSREFKNKVLFELTYLISKLTIYNIREECPDWFNYELLEEYISANIPNWDPNIKIYIAISLMISIDEYLRYLSDDLHLNESDERYKRYTKDYDISEFLDRGIYDASTLDDIRLFHNNHMKKLITNPL